MITLAANKIFNLDINFYTTPTAWYTILVIVNVWKGAGVNAIIYYATLLNCDASLFEAAEIDGANSFQKMWHISIPFLRSMICVTTIMSGANILRTDLGLFMFVPKESASLLSAVDTIDYYIWRTIRVSGNFSVGAAVGLVQGVVGLVPDDSFEHNRQKNRSGSRIVLGDCMKTKKQIWGSKFWFTQRLSFSACFASFLFYWSYRRRLRAIILWRTESAYSRSNFPFPHIGIFSNFRIRSSGRMAFQFLSPS